MGAMKFTTPTILLNILLAFPGCLFILKYSSRIFPHPFLLSLCYLGFFAIQSLAALWLAQWVGKSSHPKRLLVLGVATYLAAVLVIYTRMNPLNLRTDRWSALQGFLNALFHGSYPYQAMTHLDHPISGFPVLFLLALPFYGLGDVGYLQLAAFVAFALLLVLKFREGARPVFLLGLLIGMPAFEYDVFCRSDLFANMVVVAWLIHSGLKPGSSRGPKLFFWAMAWGLMLSTRGIVVIPLILSAFHLLRDHDLKDWIGFGLILAATFFATFLPLYSWNPNLFWEHNPFNVQSGYIPTWALAIVLFTACFLGYRHRENPRLFFHSGILLFSTVLLCLVLKVMRSGWAEALWGSQFDISYFSLSIPFLLLALGGSFPKLLTGEARK